METPMLSGLTSGQGACEISPVLEHGSPTPLSTHWIPLHELIAYWTHPETVQLPEPVAPLLTAIGHALFALGRETRALRCYTLAWQHQQWHSPAAVSRSRGEQTVRHLHEAAHHWSRAAFVLDSLGPGQLDPDALARARRLSRIARTQQERLWALIDEVQAEIQTGDAGQQQQEASA
jgi:hypothetical protein